MILSLPIPPIEATNESTSCWHIDCRLNQSTLLTLTRTKTNSFGAFEY